MQRKTDARSASVLVKHAMKSALNDGKLNYIRLAQVFLGGGELCLFLK